MRLWALGLGLPLILTACAPDMRCAGRQQADLRAIDAQISALDRDIARGYRVEPARDPQTTLRLCAWPKEPVLFCTTSVKGQSAQRVVLDIPAAQAERAALQQRRNASVAALADAQAQCLI